jgi:uncharacterized protein
MPTADVSLLTHQVLWAAFGLALAFGAIAQHSHFCTMGAIADVVSMGDWTRVRMWALAVGMATVGFGLMAGLGAIDPAAALYTSPRLLWASAIVGGLLFGAGMVLSSGCGAKSLVRVGGGNLKSLVVVLVMGASAFATLRGITAVLRVESVDRWFVSLPSGQDLPALLAGATGAARPTLSLTLGLLIGTALCLAALWRAQGARASLVAGGVGVGLLVAGMWWVSGHLGFVPEHPETLEPTYLASNSRSMEAFSFVAPAAYTLDWLLLFSDRSKALTFGVVTPLGVVLGSWLVALATRRFRWEGFGGAAAPARHLVGALMMGVGGVTALGCSIGQGVSGLSTLSLGSLLATGAIVAGAVATLRWEIGRLERLA